jgi:nocardicin N-oxygenase
VLTDPRFSRAAAAAADVPRLVPEPASRASIVMMDPPEHTRLRGIVAKAFTARRVTELRPRLEQQADELLAAIGLAGPPADLVADFALPLSIGVICELLGVPYEDRDKFRTWSTVALSSTAHPPDEIRAAVGELGGYLSELIWRRRAEADAGVISTDLFGELVRARDDDRLTEQELVTTGATLLAAGYENTANTIANFTMELLALPARWERLRAEPERVPAAVEEMLRFTMFGLGANFARIATEPVELGGVRIGAGEAVFTSLPAANRDPAVFDRAGELDLTRPDNPHLAFGHGIHHCLGAQLARLELQVALTALLRRLPGLRLAVAEAEIPWKTGLLVRGPESLPVTW